MSPRAAAADREPGVELHLVTLVQCSFVFGADSSTSTCTSTLSRSVRPGAKTVLAATC